MDKFSSFFCVGQLDSTTIGPNHWANVVGNIVQYFFPSNVVHWILIFGDNGSDGGGDEENEENVRERWLHFIRSFDKCVVRVMICGILVFIGQKSVKIIFHTIFLLCFVTRLFCLH